MMSFSRTACVLLSKLHIYPTTPSGVQQLFLGSCKTSSLPVITTRGLAQKLQDSKTSPVPTLTATYILSKRAPNALPPSVISKEFVGQTVLNSSPVSNDYGYSCPSRLLEYMPQTIILDPFPGRATVYDCPVSCPVLDTVAPETYKSEILEPGSKPVAKEAKIILRIRHKKMKKHKLRKLRKRMYFLWRKQRLAKKARRLAEYNKELDEIRATGTEFNAEEFVRAQLAKARRGGFYINVFNSKQ